MVRMRDGVRENGRIKLKKGERKEIRKGNRKRINYPFLLYLIVTETLSWLGVHISRSIQLNNSLMLQYV